MIGLRLALKGTLIAVGLPKKKHTKRHVPVRKGLRSEKMRLLIRWYGLTTT